MMARFALQVALDILANLVGYALDWLFPAFANAEGNLPVWLRWFQTHDATLDGVGRDGVIEPRFVASTSWLRTDDGAPRNTLCRYLCRVAWLYRNNAYDFSIDVLGAQGPFQLDRASGALYAPVAHASPTNRYPAQGGWRCELYRGANGHLYFHFWWVLDRGNGKCHEANVGWKIAAGSERAQLVCRYSPWRAYESNPVA
ncbi:hypothetical protein DFLDMN_001080 [Cupriavidus sp. H19C3]|uniref:DUF7338 family protein n=1 Tax=Cupriavidus sp. H19C3 TaxID=3241603 RepID=UPI003BF82C2A